MYHIRNMYSNTHLKFQGSASYESSLKPQRVKYIYKSCCFSEVQANFYQTISTVHVRVEFKNHYFDKVNTGSKDGGFSIRL